MTKIGINHRVSFLKNFLGKKPVSCSLAVPQKTSRMKDEITISCMYDAPIERVWNALTDNNEMKQWYFQLPEFRPEVGFEFQFEGGPDDRIYVHKCKITEVVPGQRLAYTWRYDGLPGNSLVTFELLEDDSRTKVTVTHEGLDTIAVNGPDFQKQNFVEGWTHILGKSLKEYVEK
jgi:uncharacterized protein YndB with AHSA1/START domain